MWRSLSFADAPFVTSSSGASSFSSPAPAIPIFPPTPPRRCVQARSAEVLLKATKVDGVYDSDPNKNPNAKRYEQVSYTEALSKRLQVMDSTAFSLCMDNKIPIVIFNMNEPDNIRDAVLGRKIGTLVCD